MRYLFIVAHPDDEVLGAGGYIHKLTTESNDVAVAIMCSAATARMDLSDSLMNDQAESMNVLGVSKVYPGDFPNIKMNLVSHLDLVQFIEKCILDYKPHVIITHHPSDTNNDHVQTSMAVQSAFRIFQRKSGLDFQINSLLYMEVLSSTEWSLDTSSNRFTPNYFVQIYKDGLDYKLRALSCYKGVMRPFPHPRSYEGLAGLAAYRGVQSGCEYAEAFELAFVRKL